MQTSNEIDKIAPALVKAQSELKHAVKDAENSAFKQGGKASKYADLSAVWDAAKPVLTANKMAALQDVVSNENGMGVRTRLLHESGQWIEFDPPIIPLDRKNAHGAGSVLTYGRRYSLSAALGVVADEDDDGNAASQGNGTRVADAQSTTDTAKVKNAPGISKARTWVGEEVRTINGCEGPKNFMEHLESSTAMWVRICSAYPSLWLGPDGTGLRGEGTKTATVFECRDVFDQWISKIERLAKETTQQAAE